MYNILGFLILNLEYVFIGFVFLMAIYFLYLIKKQKTIDENNRQHIKAFEDKIAKLNQELNNFGYIVSSKWKPTEDEGRVESLETGRIVGDYVRLNADHTGDLEVYRFSLNYLPSDKNILDISLNVDEAAKTKKINLAQFDFAEILDCSKRNPSKYLKINGVKQHTGIKVSDRNKVIKVNSKTMKIYKGDLLIPIKNISNEIISYQVINKDGMKNLRIGTSIKGGFFEIGKIDRNNNQQYILSEDYLTGATLHRATGKTVLVCFDVQNMHDVAAAILELNNKNELVFATARDKLVNNTPRIRKGLFYANAYNMPFIFPKFEDGKKFDHFKTWNELQRYESDESINKMVQDQIDYFKNTGKRNTINIVSNKFGLKG